MTAFPDGTELLPLLVDHDNGGVRIAQSLAILEYCSGLLSPDTSIGGKSIH